MNQILAGIYGTNGFEKVASAHGHINSLSDLAVALLTEELPEGADLEKVASAHDGVLEELAFYDLSGRAAAQAEFSAMEKAASEGDDSALTAFFAEEEEADEDLRTAVLQELQRRRQP